MTESCANCRFHHGLPWESEGAKGVNHFCREKPPEFIPPASSTLKPVDPTGWCGRWQAMRAPVATPRKRTTKSVPAPGSDPNHVSFSDLSLPNGHDFVG